MQQNQDLNPAAFVYEEQEPEVIENEIDFEEDEETLEDAIEEETVGSFRFGMTLIGAMSIIISLVMLWKHERKLVTFSRFITEARKECRNIDADKPQDQDDYWLVHARGKVEN